MQERAGEIGSLDGFRHLLMQTADAKSLPSWPERLKLAPQQQKYGQSRLGRSTVNRLLLGLGILSLVACTFEAPPAIAPFRFPPTEIPLSPLVDSSSRQVFDDPGNLVAFHGFGCAEWLNEPDRPGGLRVRQSQQIPRTMNSAAVILSGWQFRSLRGDHELWSLGTAIGAIRRTLLDDGSHALEWEAYGGIADGDFDDPYRWCYHFTALAWNRDAYAVYIDQRDSHAFAGDSSGREVPFGWETALSFHPSFVEIYPSGGSASAMILPRGFGFHWLRAFEDHNLLQLAYNLDPGAPFIADGRQYSTPSPDLGGADQAGRTYYSWETKTILKDNALRRDYSMGELVSVASGSGVEAVHPPFTIVPVEDHGNCVPVGEAGSESRSIGGIPFDVAIPVLTGWDLSYVCDDREVQEIGFWIDDFAYDPGTSGPRADGRLDYTVRSVLRDQGSGGGASYRHRVSILGLRKQPPMPPTPSLSVLPDVLRFPYPDHRGLPATTRNAFLDNFGNAPADRTAVAVVGPDATLFELVSQHPPTLTLPPGGNEQFTLRLAVPCGAPTPSASWSAVLRIDTTEGRFEVPIVGQPYPCVTSDG
jgi:hypothetical protein